MKGLNPKDQKQLQELLMLYDQLIKEMELDGDSTDLEKAQRILDIYNAISELLKKAKNGI